MQDRLKQMLMEVTFTAGSEKHNRVNHQVMEIRAIVYNRQRCWSDTKATGTWEGKCESA